MLKDAIDTAAQSGNRELAEDLLRYFVDKKDKECFSACLFTCYRLVRPDIALELAWRSRYMDFVMPFLIQFLRHSSEKVRWCCAVVLTRAVVTCPCACVRACVRVPMCTPAARAG
jgi:hypothetical protein